ncbi:hypothetical protein [Achromobacter sp. Bel]|uniref:hypothetical protein n=1 Tax=Achromobacter sp. Bel TaxID=2727415 RepID=UPI00145D69BC|nr:hypothetical protein [Achromobacter sp. Bel]NMK45521.1 hypothetical protein [Achromobacter sp. Bel]
MAENEFTAQELRDLILKQRPTFKPTKVLGERAYLRTDMSVGEANAYFQDARRRKVRIAQKLGIDLNHDEPMEVQLQLEQITDPYAMASRIAHRLCDAGGNRVFDPSDEADLEFINSLGKEFLSTASDEEEEPSEKN